ncbi:MAG: hypothetical protein NZ899_04365 [Thermoguttaceae bacterium]|nr:hypothetical protein [Thermoguttaceae bacterium]
MAGVVGYMTHYIAVQMLFVPYHTNRLHWLHFLTFGLWRQGVVTARKDEIPGVAGT